MKMELNKLYEEMYLQIKLDNEAYTNKQMQSVYKEHKKALNDITTLFTALFTTHGIDGVLKLTTKQKAEIRSEISSKLKKMGKTMAENEVNKVTQILEDIAKESYNLTAYVMDYGTQVQLKLPLIRQEFIDEIVNAEFKGEMFSSRIWKNKDSLIKKLRLELEESMKGKKTIDQVARNIKKEFAVKTYESQRLVVTECARIQVLAQEEIGKNAGVEYVLWLATLDKKTNEFDASLDGKRWRIDEDHPRPVYDTHPNCRCSLLNVPPTENWQPKKRKDNESKEVIDYKDYAIWLKEKVEN
jgi:SPP1 gp7 family putative phage head morphogenesis protein